jgi:hypothetical protein
MPRLGLLCTFLACARALHLQQETKLLCGTVLLSNSKTSMYNMAFEVSENHIVKNWHFEFMDEGPGSTQQVWGKSCAKMSYLESFKIPSMLPYNDNSEISIEKVVCVYPNAMTENVWIRNIPVFKEAFVNTTAYEGPGNSLVVASSFDMSVPWILSVWQGAATSYIRDRLTRHMNQTSARICVEPRDAKAYEKRSGV